MMVVAESPELAVVSSSFKRLPFGRISFTRPRSSGVSTLNGRSSRLSLSIRNGLFHSFTLEYQGEDSPHSSIPTLLKARRHESLLSSFSMAPCQRVTVHSVMGLFGWNEDQECWHGSEKKEIKWSKNPAKLLWKERYHKTSYVK